MADPNNPADESRVQTAGRKENAAQDLNAADDKGGAERYPSVRADDAVERSFEPKAPSETPPSPNEGRLGPAADPAEGKPE